MKMLMAQTIAAVGILTTVAAQAGAAQSVQITNSQMTLQADQVELRGLDTLNGTARDLPVTVGETIRFGHLEITVDTCRIPEDNPAGDAYAFLRIRDIREETPRFNGWMFAASPALSALDHPRYDVWLISCSTR